MPRRNTWIPSLEHVKYYSDKDNPSSEIYPNATIQIEEEQRPLFEALPGNGQPSYLASPKPIIPKKKRMYRWLTICILLCLNYILAFTVYFGRLLQSDMTYVFLFRPQWLGIFFVRTTDSMLCELNSLSRDCVHLLRFY